MNDKFAAITPIDTTNDALETVGGKGRSLAQMTRAGFDVPEGFLLSTAAYRDFVADNELGMRILDSPVRRSSTGARPSSRRRERSMRSSPDASFPPG